MGSAILTTVREIVMLFSFVWPFTFRGCYRTATEMSLYLCTPNHDVTCRNQKNKSDVSISAVKQSFLDRSHIREQVMNDLFDNGTTVSMAALLLHFFALVLLSFMAPP